LRRGWKTKSWTQKDGKCVGGLLLSNPYVHRILTNVSYLGKVQPPQHHAQVYEGEQEAIIEPALWMRTRAAFGALARENGIDIGATNDTSLINGENRRQITGVAGGREATVCAIIRR